MSYNPQVRGIGETRFTGNDLFFETPEEALAYAADLQGRWMGCQRGADNRRAFESDRAVNYRWEKGRLVAVGAREEDPRESPDSDVRSEAVAAWGPLK